MDQDLRDRTVMEAEAQEADGTTATTSSMVSRPARRTWVAFLVFWAVVATAAVGFTSYRLFLSTVSKQESADVASTAKRFVTELTTYAYSDGSYDKRVQALSTGKFRKEFADISGGGAFARRLDETKASSRGQVASVNVESLNGDAATAFVVVDKTVSNSSKPQPETERNRIELTLVKTTKGWRIDSVTVL
ncbi:MAG: hypothetical protein ABR507_09500 [Actinomycetota bacterium]|nr:hypothetical protein [Actinomycetota bacterium]